MALRKIVEIDEAKCDGCGVCVNACAEGAIEIRGGKAKLVSEVYCDGMGACLGECPQGAIRIIEREAVAFDEDATRRHLERGEGNSDAPATVLPTVATHRGCPGSAVQMFQLTPPDDPTDDAAGDEEPSALSHWPVQLGLVPPGARFLQGADVLLVADCVPFALADFHRRILRGQPVLIGCPKLDDAQAHVAKLARILAGSSIRTLTVVHMEVPCCMGLVRIAQAAIERSGADLRLEHITISTRGKVFGSPKGLNIPVV